MSYNLRLMHPYGGDISLYVHCSGIVIAFGWAYSPWPERVNWRDWKPNVDAWKKKGVD